MRPIRRLTLTTAAVAALATGVAGTASAAAEPFGQHVSTCAHDLGMRASTPAVTCTHDGATMTFATFGAMVEHMRDLH